jgi:hypothetical protein
VAVSFPDSLSDFGKTEGGDGFERAAAYLGWLIGIVDDVKEGSRYTFTVVSGNLPVLSQQGKSPQCGGGSASDLGRGVLLYQAQQGTDEYRLVVFPEPLDGLTPHIVVNIIKGIAVYAVEV